MDQWGRMGELPQSDILDRAVQRGIGVMGMLDSGEGQQSNSKCNTKVNNTRLHKQAKMSSKLTPWQSWEELGG